MESIKSVLIIEFIMMRMQEMEEQRRAEREREGVVQKSIREVREEEEEKNVSGQGLSFKGVL